MRSWRPHQGLALKGVVVVVECDVCDGKGRAYDSNGSDECPECKGDGEVTMQIDPSVLRRIS